VCEDTPHSRHVARRERAQVSEVWSELASNVDGEGESRRRNGLKEDLERRLGGGR
jgi:hypothetical protein